jgi:hypothetical protein
MTTYLAFYEGFLVNKHQEPILASWQMIQILGERNRVVLATSDSRERVEHQLKTERVYQAVTEVIDKTVELSPLPLWQRQIEVARSRYLVTTIIAADPEIAQYAIEHGIVVLFYAHPSFSQPAIRPQVGSRKWESLIEELDSR